MWELSAATSQSVVNYPFFSYLDLCVFFSARVQQSVRFLSIYFPRLQRAVHISLSHCYIAITIFYDNDIVGDRVKYHRDVGPSTVSLSELFYSVACEFRTDFAYIQQRAKRQMRHIHLYHILLPAHSCGGVYCNVLYLYQV